MPLVWAHGEYLKLYAARASKQPIELLTAVEKRYGRGIPSKPRPGSGATRRRSPSYPPAAAW